MRGLIALALLAIISMGLIDYYAHAEEMQTFWPGAVPQNTTTAALPACVAANAGVVFRVTDALLPALGISIGGGGAVSVLVRCNGTNWLVGQ